MTERRRRSATAERDLALVVLAGTITIVAMACGTVLAAVAHLPAVSVTAIVGLPSAVAVSAIGRLSGTSAAPAPEPVA